MAVSPTIAANTLLMMVPTVVALGIVVHASKLAFGPRATQQGNYVVRVSSGGRTKYVGVFKNEAAANEYATNVKFRFPKAKVTVLGE